MIKMINTKKFNSYNEAKQFAYEILTNNEYVTKITIGRKKTPENNWELTWHIPCEDFIKKYIKEG